MTGVSNPVLREGMTIYWKEGQAFPAYFFYLVILSSLEFVALILPVGDAKFWLGPAFLFKFSAVVALLLLVYFSLRMAGLEFAGWKFTPLRQWLREEKLGVGIVALGLIFVLFLHVLLLVILSIPMLAWSGAIARTSLETVVSTVALLCLYAVSYGVWGLVALTFWERKVDSRRVFVRWIFVCFFLLSGVLVRTLNPVAFLLYHVGTLEMTGSPMLGLGWFLTPVMIHMLFHFVVLAFSLCLLAWGLKRIEKGYA